MSSAIPRRRCHRRATNAAGTVASELRRDIGPDGARVFGLELAPTRADGIASRDCRRVNTW